MSGVGAVPADEPTPREALTQREEDMAAVYQRIIDGAPSIRQPVIDEATSHVEYLTGMSHSWIVNGDEHHGAMLQALCIAHGWLVEDLAAAEAKLAETQAALDATDKSFYYTPQDLARIAANGELAKVERYDEVLARANKAEAKLAAAEERASASVDDAMLARMQDGALADRARAKTAEGRLAAVTERLANLKARAGDSADRGWGYGVKYAVDVIESLLGVPGEQ